MKRKALILKASRLLEFGNSDGNVLSQICNPLDAGFDSQYFKLILSTAKRFNSIYNK